MTDDARLVILTLLVGLASGAACWRLAEGRRSGGQSPYDRPGFPAPALWGLIGWLVTPLALPIFLWRFGWRRWILPALLGWWLLLRGIAFFTG